VEKKVMKVTLTDFKDVDGDEARSELEFPEHWNIFVFQLMDSLLKIGKNNAETHLFGYTILLGEPHPKDESAVETGVYVRVSPNLPDSDGFKRMLMQKVSQVWKEHMMRVNRGVEARCTATDKEKGETTLDDLTVSEKRKTVH
jgi:hypothetical protein